MKQFLRSLGRVCRDAAHAILTGILMGTMMLLPVPISAQFPAADGSAELWIGYGRAPHYFQMAVVCVKFCKRSGLRRRGGRVREKGGERRS
jgi:hypothetical protein